MPAAPPLDLATVSLRIAVPKEAPADSFVLHAPLELLARTQLYRLVRETEQPRASARIEWLADTYDKAGEPAAAPAAFRGDGVDDAVRRLVDAMGAGELDDVDSAAVYIGEHANAEDLRRLLGASVVASLAAAAHASILLWLLPRVSAWSPVTCALVRGPARELARNPDWRIRWLESPGEPTTESLVDALLEVPMLGVPGSDFIYPIMNQAEESGVAPRLLAGLARGPIDVARVRREVARVAAWSMLQEPPDYAPYGWSHCLTMPQAVMGIAGDGTDPRVAATVAATHVVGFRAALGQRQLVAGYKPEPGTNVDLAEAMKAGPKAAAAWVWHAPETAIGDVITDLATNAALHHDAHLVKYTLACFDAADADPEQRRLYLSAAASLAGWWSEQPSDGFFD